MCQNLSQLKTFALTFYRSWINLCLSNGSSYRHGHLALGYTHATAEIRLDLHLQSSANRYCHRHRSHSLFAFGVPQYNH